VRLLRFSEADERKLNRLMEVVDTVTDWMGGVAIDIRGDGCLGVEKAKKYLKFCPKNLDEFLEHLRRALEEKGYEVKDYEFYNIRKLIATQKRSDRRTYVLIEDIASNAPEEIKKEFERYKGRLIRTIELPEGFELRKSWAGDIMLYFRGYPCSRVFFSHSKSGWYNITLDRPQTPEEFEKAYRSWNT